MLDGSLGAFLDRIASGEPAPGGGAATAASVSMAAALVAMAARLSLEHMDGAAELVARAEDLRARTAPLAQADAEAYTRVLAANRPLKDLPSERRAELIGAALSAAADVPLAVAEAAAELGPMAAVLAENGNPNLRGDAVAAALLAAAGASSAAVLVAINLGPGDDDGRGAQAKAYAATASTAAERATATAL